MEQESRRNQAPSKTVTIKTLKEQFIKLDEKIAKLDPETFDSIACDSIKLGEMIESFEKKLQQNSFDVKVWVQDKPMKPIPNFPEAIEGEGHYEKRKAVLLEKILGEGLK